MTINGPFARQEKDWYRMEPVLPRADMANWSIRCCEETAAAYFYYSCGRSGKVARQLLPDFDGYLITNAYSGYGTVGKRSRIHKVQKAGNI